MADSHAQDIATNVRMEMARQLKTQTEMGKVVGLTQQALSRRLRSEVDFSVSELFAVANFLGVPVSALMVKPAEPVAS